MNKNNIRTKTYPKSDNLRVIKKLAFKFELTPSDCVLARIVYKNRRKTTYDRAEIELLEGNTKVKMNFSEGYISKDVEFNIDEIKSIKFIENWSSLSSLETLSYKIELPTMSLILFV